MKTLFSFFAGIVFVVLALASGIATVVFFSDGNGISTPTSCQEQVGFEWCTKATQECKDWLREKTF